MITYDRLRELLLYRNGIMYWRVSKGAVAKGSVAGGLDKSNGYHYIRLDGKGYKRSRLTWLYHHGEWPKHQVDHKDRIRTNDKIKNLREATNQENMRNRTKRCDNTSGITGIKATKNGVFYARLKHKGKLVLDHKCSTLEEAIKIREAAKIEYGFHANHGE